MITPLTLDQKEANFGYFDSLTNISSHLIPKPYSRNQIQGMQGLIPAMVALGGIQVLCHHVFGFFRPTHPPL